MKTKYISLVFVLLIAATLVKLLYQPKRISTNRLNSLAFATDAVTVCSLYGFKCPDPNQECDCQTYCTDGDKELISFRVLDEDRVHVLNRRLEPGFYCLPKGVGQCNPESIELFSLTGWSCIPQNAWYLMSSTHRPCYHPEAEDNSLNVLYDNLRNRPAEEPIENIYQTLSDGSNRFKCQCQSKDVYGNPMINVMPLKCSIDYCLTDIPNPLPMMGWNGNECRCGPYGHEDEQDFTSKCVRAKTEVRKSDKYTDALIGRVDCMNQASMRRSNIYCPPNENDLNFTVPVMYGQIPIKFVETTLLSKARM